MFLKGPRRPAQEDTIKDINLGFVIPATLFALALAGCGGGGGGNGGGPAANPYTGAYSGEFVDSNDTIGSVSMSVSTSGAVSGSFGYPTPVGFSGNVNASGKGSITSSQGTFQVTLGSAGKATLGGGIGTHTNGQFVTLISNPNGQFSGLSGDYAGTVHNNTLNATGIIALSISSSGVVTGVDLFNVGGVPTLESVSGSVSSGGALSYKVAGVTVTGTVSLGNSTISGTLHESNGNTATLSISQVSD